MDFEKEKTISKAVGFFKQGYNCSQSVAMAFAERYGIDEELMSRISASFGGGIGRMRETCGSACAMFLLAGLEVKNTEDDPDAPSEPYPNQQQKKKNYEVVQYLAEEFRKVTGSIICRELLLRNKKIAENEVLTISPVPEARTDDYYKKRPCVRMVETAVTIYMNYLEEKYKFGEVIGK